MMAVIGDSNNHGSIHLHRSCGFTPIGTAQKLGFKFDQWLDVVYMQYKL
jgi:phosphinothricin acetyltransferase